MRYMRHGNDNISWLKQDRNDPIRTQCICVEEIYDTIYHPNEDFYFIQYEHVYARIENKRNDQ